MTRQCNCERLLGWTRRSQLEGVGGVWWVGVEVVEAQARAEYCHPQYSVRSHVAEADPRADPAAATWYA